jgi:IS30 family transposase
MRSYTQLTREQQYQIRALLKMGHDQSQIAKAIDVNRSTVSRELRRNRGSVATDRCKPIAWRWRDVGRRRSGLVRPPGPWLRG